MCPFQIGNNFEIISKLFSWEVAIIPIANYYEKTWLSIVNALARFSFITYLFQSMPVVCLYFYWWKHDVYWFNFN